MIDAQPSERPFASTRAFRDAPHFIDWMRHVPRKI
jgi:hypothetical protein